MRYPAISPDGQSIVFTYKGDLWRVAAAGGAATHLTQHVAHDYQAVWRPDGQQLVFASDRHGNFDLYVMPAAGGEATNRQYPTGSLPELYRIPVADHALPAEHSAVAIERGDPHQGGDRFASRRPRSGSAARMVKESTGPRPDGPLPCEAPRQRLPHGRRDDEAPTSRHVPRLAIPITRGSLMSESKRSGPIPPLPEKIVLPNIAVTREEVGSFEVPPTPTFYYAGIQSLWLWYKVPLATLRAYLNPLEMTPYDFGGTGAVNINFFNAAAMYGMGQPGNQGIGGFNETEVNIVGFASKVADKVQQGLTLEQYLTLGDVTKRIGNYRVWVACDDAVAVAAGRQVFMENKFLTPYNYNVPSLNNQKGAPKQFTWDWTCLDPKTTPKTPPESQVAIYQTSVNLDGLSAVPGYMTEVIDLSFDTTSRRPVASRRNFLGMFDTFLQPGVAKAVTMTYGKSEHPMRHDMEKLVGQHHAVAIQRFESPPCILEAAGYYADE